MSKFVIEPIELKYLFGSFVFEDPESEEDEEDEEA